MLPIRLRDTSTKWHNGWASSSASNRRNMSFGKQFVQATMLPVRPEEVGCCLARNYFKGSESVGVQVVYLWPVCFCLSNCWENVVYIVIYVDDLPVGRNIYSKSPGTKSAFLKLLIPNISETLVLCSAMRWSIIVRMNYFKFVSRSLSNDLLNDLVRVHHFPAATRMGLVRIRRYCWWGKGREQEVLCNIGSLHLVAPFMLFVP